MMATWYVRTDGSDANTPTGSETPPIDGTVAFATVGHALNSGGTGNASLANGDEVRVCNDGTHNFTTSLICDTVGGSLNLPLVLIGAAADGSLDGSIPVLNFSGVPALTDGFVFASGLPANSLMRLINLRVTAATRDNVSHQKAASELHLVNCRLDNAGASGFHNNRGGGTVHPHTLTFCEIDNNGSHGIGIDNNNRVGPYVYCCVIHDNGGDGMQRGAGASDGQAIVNSLIYRNGGDGINSRAVWSPNTGHYSIIGCTIDSNGGNGINFQQLTGTPGAAIFDVVNTSISNNTGTGINLNTLNVQLVNLLNTSVFNNTPDFSDGLTLADFYSSGSSVGVDPQYTSTTPGSENYEPTSGSPLVGAGILGTKSSGGVGYMDIGALQRQMGGGAAGGLIVHPGMTGGIRS